MDLAEIPVAMQPRSQSSMCLPVYFIVVITLCLPLAAAAQTVVTPDNLQDWLIGPFGAPPPADFVDGPDAPPFGVGSYATQIVEPASKIILARTDYHDVPLDQLTALSFWTYIAPDSANVNNWYVNLYLDADGDGIYETRLDYVPPPAAVTTGVWQFWDAFTGMWSSPGGDVTLADFLIANPNARINAFNDPMGGALRWNMGDTASGYVGFDGNLDGVRIAAGGSDTTWDFELSPPVVTVGIPTLSPVGSVLLVMILAVVAIMLRTPRSTRS